MKTFRYSFKSVPVLARKGQRVSSKQTRITTFYDLSNVSNHVLELSVWQLVFSRYALSCGITTFVGGTAGVLYLASELWGESVISLLCLPGALVSLVVAIWLGRDVAIDMGMLELAVRERGGEKSDWKCVKDKDWEKFVSSLS